MALKPEQPILTIAIPTYNRGSYLDRALNSIYTQIINKNYQIEIIVSNNCSTDNTEQVVENYMALGFTIHYIKNLENKGADFNIIQCFKKANGKFVLVFGDDDLFNEGAILRILSILGRYGDTGLFYLNWKVVDNNQTLKPISEVVIYKDYSSFFEEVKQSITFISGIIVNAKFINECNFEKYQNTSLPQIALLLMAAFNSPYNIGHKEALVSVQPENSGGYSFRKVFGVNLKNIFDEFNTDSKRNKVFSNIQERLLMENFPVWVYRTKTQNHTYVEDSDNILKSVFSKFYHYWLFVYPVVITPSILIKALWPLFRIYKSSLRILILSLKSKSNSEKELVKINFE